MRMIHISAEKAKPSFHASSHIFPQENIFTIPNLISVSRIALSPVLGYLVLVENYIFALGLFSLAGISDLVSHLRQVGWVLCTCSCTEIECEINLRMID